MFFLAIYYNCYGDVIGMFDFLSTNKVIIKNKDNCKLISFKSDNLYYVIKKELQQFVGEYVKTINLNQYKKGIYLLEIITNYGTINKKLILQ